MSGARTDPTSNEVVDVGVFVSRPRKPTIDSKSSISGVTAEVVAPVSIIRNNASSLSSHSPRYLASLSLSPPSEPVKASSQSSYYARSPYRPDVPADRRVLLWTTPHSKNVQQALDSEIPPHLQVKIFRCLLDSVSYSTRHSYGIGLLRFTQFCDREHISEESRMPASGVLLSAFIVDASGSYSSECIRNWIEGLRFWHMLNRAEWHGDDPLVLLLTKSANKGSGTRNL
ncbi:hypothetical protein D9615_009161 [Tricholomella constricta]|uniref:Uncharacterized protein n=1 Tax=Tricholomella constricta TaxID=117010 RepID=A0A8H5LZQ8_9AGAR|nr:hypothetical protein D9615_009161 [Tricholomella constricta]